MRAQVVDTVVVVDAAVFFNFIVGAEAVFHDEQRFLIAFVQFAQRVAQAHRVNLPAPVGGFDVRVRHAAFEAGDGIAAAAFRFDRVGHVVAETEVIAGAFTQDLFIARCHNDVKTAALPLVEDVGRVVAAQLHVGKDITFTHGLLGEHHVFRLTGERIERHHGQHAADLHLWIDPPRCFHRQRAGNELVMQYLVHGLFRVFVVGIDHAGTAVAEQRGAPVALVVDLVEGHPVFHFVLIALEDHFGEAHKEIDHFAVGPATVLLHQMQRHFEVGEGNHWLDVVLQQLIEHVVIELQPLFVWLSFITLREDTGPGDGGTEALESHLSKQLDVFFVAAVEINGFVVRVVLTRFHLASNLARHAVSAAGQHIANAWAFALFIPAAFNLMRGNRAAP